MPKRAIMFCRIEQFRVKHRSILGWWWAVLLYGAAIALILTSVHHG
jgi:hypothetical protein